jgi:hypothetical protein
MANFFFRIRMKAEDSHRKSFESGKSIVPQRAQSSQSKIKQHIDIPISPLRMIPV